MFWVDIASGAHAVDASWPLSTPKSYAPGMGKNMDCGAPNVVNAHVQLIWNGIKLMFIFIRLGAPEVGFGTPGPH